jgi:hypothetical protein
MSIAAALAEVVAAVEAAGVRVAIRDGDITPPAVYIRIGSVSDQGVPLAGGTMTGFYLYFIPIRGVDNLAGDADTLDALYAALAPLAWADLTATASSVTVKNDTWPCYRLDLSVADAAALISKG